MNGFRWRDAWSTVVIVEVIEILVREVVVIVAGVSSRCGGWSWWKSLWEGAVATVYRPQMESRKKPLYCRFSKRNFLVFRCVDRTVEPAVCYLADIIIFASVS